MKATDYLGETWDVTEERPTGHGFGLLIGKPVGAGRGAPQVIPTRPLVDLLLANAHQVANPDLPIGKGAIGRVRKMLRINRYTSIADWWARQDVPGTLADAATTLGRCPSAVSQQERRRGVRRNRPAGWWRQEPERSLLLAGSVDDAVNALGIAPSSVRRIRWQLRQP